MPSGRDVIAGFLGAALWALATVVLSRLDASLPLWITFLGLGAAGVVGFVAGRLMRVGEDLPGYHAEHLGDALLTLREIFAGKLRGISFQDFLELGILAPARFGLSTVPGEQIRLSVLELDETGHQFLMAYESGHTLGRKQDFTLPRASLAGHAYETGHLQWTNNVETEPRWIRHPKADPKRAYGSLAVAPIIVSGEVVAVLNVLSSETRAFFKGDLTYMELLAAFIGLVWTLRPAAEKVSRLPQPQDSGDSERKEN